MSQAGSFLPSASDGDAWGALPSATPREAVHPRLDPEDFEALVAPHLSMFHNGILRILGNPHDTQDALQEGLLAIYKGLPKFEGRSAFSSWAYRICINCALMHRRARMRSQEDNITDFAAGGEDEEDAGRLEALREAAVAPEAHDRLEQGELRERLMEALNRLTPTQREVFVLRDLEDMDTEDVAQLLGVSSLVVRQRLHRAREGMLQMLRPLFRG